MLIAPSDYSCGPPSSGSAGVMIARQAIVNAQRAVIGYELFDRSRSSYTAASDMALLLTALSHIGPQELVGKALLFINCTHESLTGGHLELINPDKVVLEIPPLGYAARDEAAMRLPILAELRERGFHLAFTHTVLESAYAPWLPLADYIKLDMSVLPPDQVAVLVDYASRHSQAELIAEKIETAQQYDMVSSMGVQLFQGYWFSRPTLVTAKLLAPAQASIAQLLNLTRAQASAATVEDVFKRDAGLTFNLMRLIDCAELNLEREVASISQAVLLLGPKKLFHWATLLLTIMRGIGAPPAAGQTSAVVRGRFMELLARQLPNPAEAEKAFLVGLFSLLNQMLGVSQTLALDLLHMPKEIFEALLHRRGALGHLLDLAEACEAGDDMAIERAARSLDLSTRRINQAHMQALDWARNPQR